MLCNLQQQKYFRCSKASLTFVTASHLQQQKYFRCSKDNSKISSLTSNLQQQKYFRCSKDQQGITLYHAHLQQQKYFRCSKEDIALTSTLAIYNSRNILDVLKRLVGLNTRVRRDHVKELDCETSRHTMMIFYKDIGLQIFDRTPNLISTDANKIIISKIQKSTLNILSSNYH